MSPALLLGQIAPAIDAAQRDLALAEAICATRDLVNTPAEDLGPDELAQVAGFSEVGALASGERGWLERSWRRCLQSGLRPEQPVTFDVVTAAGRLRDPLRGSLQIGLPRFEK